ncbi:hypothetical protein V8G54_024069 [Vigna mungo]|uniref:Retrotransposon Copia-like N-terminal domain-containing protein n=1 Tax=Vigna mungo TaxID=3915 RepID=A0AAQ3N4Y3_VIGMU
MALISKNKMDFLNGAIPIPETIDPLYPSWERCNALLMSWILNSLSPSIAQSVMFFSGPLILRHTIDLCFQKNNITLTKCIHCDRVWHSNDVCYTKFGYPPEHPKYLGKTRPFNNKNTFGDGGTTAEAL